MGSFEFSEQSRVMVFAPHLDDEALAIATQMDGEKYRSNLGKQPLKKYILGL
jgi:hypothetical protein